jgi:hypothetical protein
MAPFLIISKMAAAGAALVSGGDDQEAADLG